MSDDIDIGEEVISGLEEALARKRGEVLVPVIDTEDPERPDGESDGA